MLWEISHDTFPHLSSLAVRVAKNASVFQQTVQEAVLHEAFKPGYIDFLFG